MRLLLLVTTWLAWQCAASAAPRPPEELFFGLSGLHQRIIYTRPLRAVSGGYQLELVEVDRLNSPSEPLLRLVVACTPPPGADPATLAVLPGASAHDATGGELALRSWSATVADELVWLTFTLAGSNSDGLSTFAATIGPRPAEQRRTVTLRGDQLGQPCSLPEVDAAVTLALVRHDPVRLETSPPGPPYYLSLDTTLGLPEPPSRPGDSHLTLRLACLQAPDDQSAWRLVNLAVAGQRDWRYVKRPWRPDWGGWLGLTGQDCGDGPTATSPRQAGVEVVRLVAGGPAESAGLQLGDRIVAADGEPVGDAFSLGDLVRQRAAGTTLRLELWRDGTRLTRQVVLGVQPLWPDLDELEFQQAWEQLRGLAPATVGPRPVLALWDWQSRVPVGQSLDDPAAIELVFARPEPPAGTTFLFRHIPLTAD